MEDENGKAVAEQHEQVLEGVFAVVKPANVSSADVLLKLQSTFASSDTFAPLRRHQPKRTSKSSDQVFRLGHGGTLDPLASGVLIVGIGRGTRSLSQYLACDKSYDTTILFGMSTDSYDCTGTMKTRADASHVTRQLVEEQLPNFLGTIQQVPPVYSALKINGMKACEYVRQGKELPQALESREMEVKRCDLLEWYDAGQHDFAFPGEEEPAPAPAVRIRLKVCSGFYVRSFAHDLGVACHTVSHMAALKREVQANFVLQPSPFPEDTAAIPYDDLDVGENVWGPKLRPQLEEWVAANPVNQGHVNGREGSTKRKMAQEGEAKPRQRFRGDWVAETKKERIKQQGGKYKGKWGRKPEVDALIKHFTQDISKYQ